MAQIYIEFNTFEVRLFFNEYSFETAFEHRFRKVFIILEIKINFIHNIFLKLIFMYYMF